MEHVVRSSRFSSVLIPKSVRYLLTLWTGVASDESEALAETYRVRVRVRVRVGVASDESEALAETCRVRVRVSRLGLGLVSRRTRATP
jgi:hypothetical protein